MTLIHWCKMMIVRGRFASIVAFLSAISAASAADDPGLEARFRSECPWGLARLEKVLDNLICEGQRITISQASKWKADARYLSKDGKKLFVHKYVLGESNPTLGAGIVSCQTPSYIFKLEQSVPGGPYLVNYHGNEPKQMERILFHMSLNFDDFMFAAFSLRDRPLRQLMDDPKFKVASVESSSKDGRELVKVVFESPGSAFWCESGWMVLEPALDWAVREFEVRYKTERGDSFVDKGIVECARWPGGFIFPKRVWCEVNQEAGKGITTYELNVSRVRVNSATDDKFTLAAFGIPELPLSRAEPPSFFSLSNWLFWACLVGAVLSFLLLRSRQRSAA